MQVLLQSTCTKPQQGVEDGEQDKVLTVQWGGGGRGDSPKGIMKELTSLPREQAWGTHTLLLMLAKNDRLVTF